MKMFSISKKRIICLVISYCAVISWMVLIFLMSSQTGTESSNTSGGLISTLCNIIIPDFVELDESEKTLIISKISTPIRKLAHFTEYFILSIVINIAVIQTKRKTSLSMSTLAISFVFGVLYAVSDEVHQLFVPGRAGAIIDVFIDSAGVAFGCVLFALMYRFIEERRK